MAFLSPIRCRRAVFDGTRTWVMGIVNVTPDSFSDGGLHADVDAAVAHGLRLVAEGADILDVGGESTRPGAPPVDEAIEIARVVPVIARLVREAAVPVSVDTRKGGVAQAALDAGAELCNDVTGGRDPALLQAVAEAGVPLVLGHLRGAPETMQKDIAFGDLFEEVTAELSAQAARADAAGVAQIVADPGIGFGKTAAHNLELLARAGELSSRLGLPVMIGASRKAFLGQLTGLPVGERLAPSVAAAVCAAMAGADFVRAHDVAATRQALAVADAVARARGGARRVERGRAA